MTSIRPPGSDERNGIRRKTSRQKKIVMIGPDSAAFFMGGYARMIDLETEIDDEKNLFPWIRCLIVINCRHGRLWAIRSRRLFKRNRELGDAGEGPGLGRFRVGGSEAGVTPRYCAGQHFGEVGMGGFSSNLLKKRFQNHFEVLSGFP